VSRQEQRALGRRVLAYLRPYRRRGVAALGLSLLQTGISVVPLLAAKLLIDRLTRPTPSFGGLALPVLLAVAAGLVAAALGVGIAYLVESVSESIVYDLREQLFDHLIDHGSAFYTHNRAGDLLTRMLGDVGGVDTTLSTTLLSLVQSALSLVATLALMVVLDWRLTLAALIVVPLVVVPTRRAGLRISRARRSVQEQLGTLTGYLQETLGLSGMLLVRVFGRQSAERHRFRTINGEMRQREIAATMTVQTFTVSLTFLGAAVPAVLLLVGGVLVVHHDASPGTVIVFATLIMGRLLSSLRSIATNTAAAIGSAALWQRIFDMLDQRPEVVEKPGAVSLTQVRGALRLEGVSFRYPQQEVPAVQEVSFEARAGELVALVGPSGAGKTTIAALIARLFDPAAGRVLLDGHDLRDLTLASISDAIGLVSQETFLFHASLRENLLYGRPEASEDELTAAVHDAHLQEVVDRLPDGYDTILGERGFRLSGGERQRVAIARTIIRDPQILVLDEATSHLDSRSERLVQNGLQRLMTGRTAIVIAHRLSTVLHADQVIVLDQGQVAESGTHDELVSSGGLYAHLHALQASPPPVSG
jgi:ATP-binding cassette subfamily B protein